MLAFQIARRYLIAKKSHQAINIISMVSFAGVTVGTMGLIIVLSVFNGFGKLVIDLYDAFDPDIKITSAGSKTFHPDSAHVKALKLLPGIKAINYSLEENALLRYRERQYIATVKGVTPGFLESSGLREKIIDGMPVLESGDTNYAIVGGLIAYSLGMHPDDPLNTIGVYIPRHDADYRTSLDPAEAFISRNIIPSGVFGIQQDFDSKYVVVPIRWAREIIGREENVTALEIDLVNENEMEIMVENIATVTGNNFHVRDRFQQHALLYKILHSEKLAVFMILGFILLIATFNIVGSLTMLIIEKKKDIAMLLSMGATLSLVKKIFFVEGLLISLSGAVAGLLLGGVTCAAQQQFGFIKLENAEAFVVDAYPVVMQPLDFIYVFLTVFVIGAAAAVYTAQAIVKKQVPPGLVAA